MDEKEIRKRLAGRAAEYMMFRDDEEENANPNGRRFCNLKHLSRFDIEAIADKYVQAYMALPDVRNTQIYRIDPELLLEKVLGLNVEYQHLSYDGSILGMTSFTEMGVQVFEDDDNEAFFFLDGKTVLVEKDLKIVRLFFGLAQGE